MACCIAHIWVSTPFFIITILAGLKGVSKELYEAADIDGANKVQSLFYITIPSLKPLLTTIILLKAIDAARGFDIIWVLAQGGPGTATQTLSIYLYKNMVQYNKVDYSSAMAIVFMAMIMVAAAHFPKILKTAGRWGRLKKRKRKISSGFHVVFCIFMLLLFVFPYLIFSFLLLSRRFRWFPRHPRFYRKHGYWKL